MSRGTPPAGGTGDAPDDGAGVVAEQYGDLHEYGLSLGVDLDADGDEDLAWAVQQAFNAPLPGSWTEYMDDTGRAYYIKDGSMASTWEHPMDAVYRELLELIKRQRSTPTPEAQREEVVKQHLKQVHQRAKADLEAWSGPYASEQGDYYYNDTLKLSTWDSPVSWWEQELSLRHRVLARYLLPEQATRGGSGGGRGDSQHMLQALRLQLGNLQSSSAGPAASSDFVPEPSTARSFHTARSQGSSRSGRRGHRDRDNSPEHRARKEQREARRRQRQEEREAAAAAAQPSRPAGEGQAYTEQASSSAPPVPLPG